MSSQEAWQVSDSAAEVYERDFVPALFAQWPPLIAEAAKLKAGERVLDVACGTGIFAREAARRVGPQGHVAGLDINEGMLAVAHRLRPDIAWRQADVCAIPFEYAAFDAVACQFGLMFFPDRVAALSEMWRVLRPGGRLAVAVWAPIERAPAEATLRTIIRQRAGDQAAGMLEAPFNLGEESLLLGLFEKAGITRPELQTHGGEARFASLDDFVRIEVKASPMAEIVSDAAYRDILADARGCLIQYAGRNGFRFTADVHIVTARKA